MFIYPYPAPSNIGCTGCYLTNINVEFELLSLLFTSHVVYLLNEKKAPTNCKINYIKIF